jgi:hypothetical protein
MTVTTTPALDATARLIEFAGKHEHKRLEESLSIAKSSAASGDAEAVALLEALESRLPQLIRDLYADLMDEANALLGDDSDADADRLGDWVRP